MPTVESSTASEKLAGREQRLQGVMPIRLPIPVIQQQEELGEVAQIGLSQLSIVTAHRLRRRIARETAGDLLNRLCLALEFHPHIASVDLTFVVYVVDNKY